MTLEIRLLGPLRVLVSGRTVELPGERLPALLAVLALSPGATVSVDRLATAVWGDGSAVHARTNLQTNVSRLRRLLGAELIETRTGGYALLVEPDQVDAVRFVRLVERDDLVAALRLWRGTPFEDIRSEWLERTQAPRLQERYLAALERRIDLELLEQADLTAALAELTELTARHPLRESLWVRLLAVLDRLGRPAEALARYEAIRVRLGDELGTDPGPELQRVYTALLAGKSPGPPTGAQPVARRVVPRQLPADTEVFTGRTQELAELDRLLDPRGGPPRSTVVCAVTGTAGIGKTTLALHWAHRVADRFPDGQLYVNLRGFDPSGSPLAPAEALRGFLDALDVSPQAMPTGLQAQAGLYRSKLADTCTLVLLDNARDAGQVVPLLPGAPGCLVLVTSRNQLPGLIAAGAHPLGLDLLSDDEATNLLIRRLGDERVSAEHSAARELVGRAAGLPLALAIVAGRAATNPRFSLASVAAQLGQARDSLDGFDGGDPASSARAAFSWSYHGLSEPAAHLYRLLGLHPGPDVTTGAAAATAGLPVARVRPLLTELTQAHLINEHAPGRYASHDLLRVFAREQAREHEPAAEQQAAIRRTLDHYVRTAHHADRLLFQHGETITLPAQEPGVPAEDLRHADQAIAWFSAERHVLLAAIGLAAEDGFDREVCHLAWSLDVFLHRQGRWHNRATAQHAALDAARRLDDPAALSRAHRHLGSAYADLGRHDEAHLHLRRALELAAGVGDTAGQAWTHYYRDLLFGLQGGQEREALDAAQHALRLFTAIQHEYGQAIALTDVGWYQGRLGNHSQALESCEKALNMHVRLGNRTYQGHTWSCLAEIHQDRGDRAKVIDCYRHALELFRKLRDRYGEASTLVNIGDHRSRQDAHAILDELDAPAADQIRTRLRHTEQTPESAV